MTKRIIGANARRLKRTTACTSTFDLQFTVISADDTEVLTRGINKGCPGVYIVTSTRGNGESWYYVGSSGGALGARINAASRHEHFPVTSVVLVTDSARSMTLADARVLERIVFQALHEDGARMSHDEPHGAMIDPDRYASLRCAWGVTAIGLKRRGLYFVERPDRLVAAGPRTWSAPKNPPTPVEVLHFANRKVDALLSHLVDGTYRLEPGSHIAASVSPVAPPILHLRRLEHLYAGVTAKSGGHIEVIAPIPFRSLSAATRYACGHHGANTAIWSRSTTPAGGLVNA